MKTIRLQPLHWFVFVLAGFMLVTMVGCAVVTSGSPFSRPTLTPTATATPQPSPTATLTPLPTATPTVTVGVSSQGQPTSAIMPSTLIPSPAAPAGSGTPVPFVLDLTQDQLNQDLKGQTYEQQGITISDISVQLTAQNAIATLHVTQPDTGIATGITFWLVPVVVDGQAYAKVQNFELDNSLGAFAKIFARQAIQQALNQYSTPNGIPIPVQGVTVTSVQLRDGGVHIEGTEP